jgi:hypothetical protein
MHGSFSPRPESAQYRSKLGVASFLPLTARGTDNLGGRRELVICSDIDRAAFRLER